MQRKQPKAKTCKVCKEKFIPHLSTAIVCSIKCAIEYTNKQNAKKDALKRTQSRLETIKKKNAIKSITEYAKDAQTAFNAYIRKRDEHLPCISCGRIGGCQFHAGHYRTTKAAPQLRFNEDNCHKQCAQCNNHLSGNITEYRINLVKKIGNDRVEELENNNAIKRYTKDELVEIKNIYKIKYKNLL